MGFIRSIFLLVLSAVAFGLPQLLQGRIGAAIKYFLIEVFLGWIGVFGGLVTGGIGTIVGAIAWFVMWMRVYEDAKYYGRY